jgi:hypothetical protein
MPEEGEQVLIAFLPALIGFLVSILSQWRVRRMASRHGEFGKSVLPTGLWPFVHTYARQASAEFRREYTPFIRFSVILVWALFGLSIVLMVRAAR